MQVHAANLGIKTFTQPVKCLIKDRRKQKCKYFFFLPVALYLQLISMESQ